MVYTNVLDVFLFLLPFAFKLFTFNFQRMTLLFPHHHKAPPVIGLRMFGADFFLRLSKGSLFAFAIEPVFEEGQFECVLLYIALLLT